MLFQELAWGHNYRCWQKKARLFANYVMANPFREARLRQQAPLIPFSSLSELRSTRKKIQGFVKTRYPTRLGLRQIRGPVSAALNWLHFVVVWLLFSPVAMLIQALPEREQRWKVAGT